MHDIVHIIVETITLHECCAKCCHDQRLECAGNQGRAVQSKVTLGLTVEEDGALPGTALWTKSTTPTSPS